MKKVNKPAKDPKTELAELLNAVLDNLLQSHGQENNPTMLNHGNLTPEAEEHAVKSLVCAIEEYLVMICVGPPYTVEKAIHIKIARERLDVALARVKEQIS